MLISIEKWKMEYEYESKIEFLITSKWLEKFIVGMFFFNSIFW